MCDGKRTWNCSPAPPQLHWRRQSCPPRSSVRHSVSFCKPRIFSQNFYNMCHITPTWPVFNGRVVGDGCSLFKTAHQHLLVWNCWVCLMRHRDIFTLLETQLDVFLFFFKYVWTFSSREPDIFNELSGWFPAVFVFWANTWSFTNPVLTN